jgi:transposase
MTTADQHQCEWKELAVAYRAELNAMRERQAEQDEKLVQLQHQHEVLIRQHFGKRSEKMDTPKDELRKRGDIAKQTPEERKEARAKGRAWKDELEREDVREPMPAAMAPCEQCCTVPSHPMPDRDSYSYELKPARIVCRRHLQGKLRCDCGCTIVTAPAQQRLYDRCQYGPELAAHLIVSKCADAIAIERVAKQLARLGVPVAGSTLGSLFHKCAELMSPLYDRLCEVVAQEPIVQADETRIKVLEKGKTRQAWIWTFNAGDLVVYRYSASRSGETPVQVLGSTTGTLVVDGYTGYNQVTTPQGRIRAGCLAHLRRKLFDALKYAPDFQVGLDLILDVYKVEHEALAAGIVRSPDHGKLRNTRSREAMDKLHSWLEEKQPKHLASSPAGQALAYGIGQWPHLQVFLGLPGVPVDNNKSERLLLVIARGRASYLFVGHDAGGQNLAILMSLVATAEASGKKPADYIADVLIRIQTHPASRIDELLPQNWLPPDLPDKVPAAQPKTAS